MARAKPAKRGNRFTRTTELNAFGERLREAMAERGVTRARLLELSGIPGTTLYRWETLPIRPQASKLARIAAVLDKSPEFLLTGAENFDQIDVELARFFDDARAYSAHLLKTHAHLDAIPAEKLALLRRIVKLHPVFGHVLLAEQGARDRDRRTAEITLPLLFAAPSTAVEEAVADGVLAKWAADRRRLLHEHPELLRILPGHSEAFHARYEQEAEAAAFRARVAAGDPEAVARHRAHLNEAQKARQTPPEAAEKDE